MNISKILVFGIVVVALMAVFALGQSDNKTDKNNDSSNVTYGTCVSQAAAVKNICFADVKETKLACRTQALNATEPKGEKKQCNKDYFAEKKECKADFKLAKKDCQKYKKAKV
jgi:hypothetical protein